jgi:hypothetical protein
MNESTIKMFKTIKEHRIAMCKVNKCQVNTKQFYCTHCKKLNAKLCRRYHVLTNEKEASEPEETLRQLATQEIVGRLLYEFVFDRLSEEDLLLDNWMYVKRDFGHTKRLYKLVRIARLLQ